MYYLKHKNERFIFKCEAQPGILDMIELEFECSEWLRKRQQ